MKINLKSEVFNVLGFFKVFVCVMLLSSCTSEEDLKDAVISHEEELLATRLTASTIQAEDYDVQSGIRVIDGSKVGYVNNGDWIKFEDFDFDGASSVSVRAASARSGGTIEFRAGSPTSDLLGTITISNTGGWNNFRSFDGNIDDDSDNSDIYLVFKGGSGYLFDVDSFVFSRNSGPEEGGPVEGGPIDEVGTNIALGKSAEQSSTGYRGNASRAIDGNKSGVWDEGSVTHTNNSSRPWWQVKLGEEYEIGQIVIWNRTDCCSDRLSEFDVIVYNNNGSLVFKETISDTPDPNVVISTGGVIGSRVRIQLKGTNALSLAEVQVFGNGGDDGPVVTNQFPPTGDTPGEILNLTNDDWKLNGFTSNPSSSSQYYDDVMDQVNGNIATWTNDNYFFENNGWAYFKCYRGLNTSRSSNNPRVELREMDDNDEEEWNGDNGRHIMSFTVRVNQLPNGWNENSNQERTTGTMSIAQIHGPSGTNDDGVEVDDTIRVQFEGSRGQTSGSCSLKISGYITEKIRGGSLTLGGYSLNREYDMQLRFINDRISLLVDGNEVFGQTMDTSGDGSYFKLGAYLQSVQNGSFDGSFGLVGYKNLSISGH